MYIHILSLQGPHVSELYTANYPINLNCALSTKLGIPIFNYGVSKKSFLDTQYLADVLIIRWRDGLFAGYNERNIPIFNKLLLNFL